MDRTEDVILQPPSQQDWLNLTEFQKALWMVDEVEARWHKFRRDFPQLRYIEVFWGKMFKGSLQAAAVEIARAIGIPLEIRIRYSREHAGDLNYLVPSNLEYAVQDRDYQERMMFPYLPG